MKRYIIFFLIIFSAFTVYAQNSDIKKETFKVEGNCGMCKKRIEEAAFVKGVKRAEWDKKTHELTVVYKSSKTTSDEILGSVAKAGHSSAKVASTEKDYKDLPECCQYKSHTCND